MLSARLAAPVERGLVERRPYRRGRDELVLTPCGEELWPVVHQLMGWGDRHFSPDGPRRLFSHVACGTDLDAAGACPACGVTPPPREVEMRPAPGIEARRGDPVTRALGAPHRLLAPLPVSRAAAAA